MLWAAHSLEGPIYCTDLHSPPPNSTQLHLNATLHCTELLNCAPLYNCLHCTVSAWLYCKCTASLHCTVLHCYTELHCTAHPWMSLSSPSVCLLSVPWVVRSQQWQSEEGAGSHLSAHTVGGQAGN